MKSSSYNNFFANFSNKTRLAIVLSLINAQRSVNEITAEINEEQSNVSHHLRSLVDCHILNVKRKGKQRIYSLNKRTVLPMLRLVSQHINKNCCAMHKNNCLKCLME